MAPEIRKELRKLRIDEDERLVDMSKRIGKSAAFISAVERGTKTPPVGFEDLIIKTYRLVGEAARKIQQAADRSRKAFIVKANTPLAKDTAGLMARRMNSLSDDELKSIFDVLNKKA